MPESNNKIPFSTIRREIRKIMHKPLKKSHSFPAVEFMPCDLKIWIGCDSDFFHRSFCHHRMILKIILAGKASTNIDGIRYNLKPADAVLYFPMQTHSTETIDSGEFEYLAISFIAGMGHYEALNTLKNRVFSPDPENSFLLDLLKAWNKNQKMHAACLLAELLSRAVSEIDGETSGNGGKFGDMAEYIRKNCSGTLSVKKIASEFDISPQSVRRIFHRNISGLTPGGLIRQQKMILAEELLRRTNLSLQEIAQQCGFSTPFSFSRAFRRQYGIPPSLYRKNI
ncbi:MAG: helix-turn-helix transcriptional regulator [Lentisphaeria bacterium]|nr:helix-turn-helix transcriptional regulator [Lentisphaeria bacterium]